MHISIPMVVGNAKVTKVQYLLPVSLTKSANWYAALPNVPIPYGLGRLLITSIGNRDFPVAECIVVIIAFVVVFMNYLADIVTQYVDPRVRLG